MVYKPGQSGNPSGRPKAASEMARMIRDMTNDGADLVVFAVQVWTGQVKEMNTEKSRQWAHDWLTDRGFGKAVQTFDSGTEIDVSPEMRAMIEAIKLTPHERRAKLDEIRAKAIPVTAPDADVDVD